MKKTLKVAATSFSLLLLAAPVLAVENPFQTPAAQSASGLFNILQSIRDWVSGIIAIIAVIMILYAAFLFITGGSSEETRGKAKTTLLYGIIGIVVAFFAYGIVNLIGSFIGR